MSLPLIIGHAIFVFGLLGLYGIYVHGVRRIEQAVIIFCAILVGGLSVVIGAETEVEKAERLEMERWKIAHCYGSSSVTEFCVPSIVEDATLKE